MKPLRTILRNQLWDQVYNQLFYQHFDQDVDQNLDQLDDLYVEMSGKVIQGQIVSIVYEELIPWRE